MTDRDSNNEVWRNQTSSLNEQNVFFVKVVEIDFEVGHVSIIRPEPTTVHNPPRTHDWRVYLRSTDVNGDLNRLIQRCVFYLHPEFPNSKRGLDHKLCVHYQAFLVPLSLSRIEIDSICYS